MKNLQIFFCQKKCLQVYDRNPLTQKKQGGVQIVYGLHIRHSYYCMAMNPWGQEGKEEDW